MLRLWTLNGRLIERAFVPNDVINCIVMAVTPLCSAYDAVLAGMGSGCIKVWSILTLDLVSELRDPLRSPAPILSVFVTARNATVLAGCEDSYVLVFEREGGVEE